MEDGTYTDPSAAFSSSAGPSTIGDNSFAGPNAACSSSAGPSTMEDGTYTGPSESYAARRSSTGHSSSGPSAACSSHVGLCAVDGSSAGSSAAGRSEPIRGASSHGSQIPLSYGRVEAVGDDQQEDRIKHVDGQSRKILSNTDCNFNLFSSKVIIKPGIRTGDDLMVGGGLGM